MWAGGIYQNSWRLSAIRRVALATTQAEFRPLSVSQAKVMSYRTLATRWQALRSPDILWLSVVYSTGARNGNYGTCAALEG